MRVVIDINVFLVSISSKSKFHPIYQNLISNQYQLILSTDILLEYQEILEREMGSFLAHYVSEALVKLPGACFISPSYFWHLMTNDTDDNKYVDAAVAGNADYIVTNDSHFKILSSLEYPKVNVVSGEQFLSMLAST